MSGPTRRSTIALSAALHAGAIVAAAYVARRLTPPPAGDPVQAVELELRFAGPAAREADRGTLEIEPVGAPRAEAPAGAPARASDGAQRPAASAHVANRRGPSVDGAPSEPRAAAPAAGPDPARPALPAPAAFLTWSRPRGDAAEPARRRGPGVNGLDVLARVGDDATNAASAGALPGGRDDEGTRVRGAVEPHIRGALEDAAPTQIAGSHPYFRRVVQEARRAWRPTPVREPSLVDAVVDTLVAPTAVSVDATARSLGPLATGRGAAAVDSLEAAHPRSLTLQPRNTMTARAAATARTTRTVVEIDQDETGAVVAWRVVRASGVAGFDDAAIHALRDAVPLVPRPPIREGGWRSRWTFEVVQSRDPIVGFLPTAPDEAPRLGLMVEATFDPETDQVEIHAPGRLHTRRRIRMLSSRVIPTDQVPRTGRVRAP